MFALIVDNAITSLSDIAGEEGDWRAVVDGTKPDVVSPFGVILENALESWIIGETVTRTWHESVPLISDCRKIQKTRLALATQIQQEAGITVGGFTFASDIMLDMLACAHIAEVMIRQNNGDQSVSFILANGTPQSITAKNVLVVTSAYCAAYHARAIALATKHRAINLSSTASAINLIV